jgi:hypothetical protein
LATVLLVIVTRGIVGRLEDRTSLTRFVIQVFHLWPRGDFALDQNEQPMLGFVGFFDNGA